MIQTNCIWHYKDVFFISINLLDFMLESALHWNQTRKKNQKAYEGQIPNLQFYVSNFIENSFA